MLKGLFHRPPADEEEDLLDFIERGLGRRQGAAFRQVREGRAVFEDLSPQARRRVRDLTVRWLRARAERRARRDRRG